MAVSEKLARVGYAHIGEILEIAFSCARLEIAAKAGDGMIRQRSDIRQRDRLPEIRDGVVVNFVDLLRRLLMRVTYILLRI